MNMEKRVLVCAITQESNSFNPVIMQCRSFGIVNAEKSGHSCVRGAISYLLSKNIECIYGISMHARSGGRIADDVVELFLNDTIDKIKNSDKYPRSTVFPL